MKKQHIRTLKTNMSIQAFRFKKIHETKNYLLEEIKHNDLMSEKYKKTCKHLNYVDHNFSFNSCWLYFNFCICFISLCSRFY